MVIKMCWLNLNAQIQLKKGEIINKIEPQTSPHFEKYATYLAKIYEYSINEYPECEELINHYKNVSIYEMSNDKIYQEICWIIYSSGFKNDIIKKYWPYITEAYFKFDINKITDEYSDIDSAAIIVCRKSNFNNLNKAKYCIYNAHRITYLNDYLYEGGLRGVLNSIINMSVLDVYSIIPELKKQLGLKGIGDVTIFHLLKNVGINIFKPDIHVLRILEYIGLFKELKSQRETYYVLKQISKEMCIDVSELDTALFVFGKNNERNFEKILDGFILLK